MTGVLLAFEGGDFVGKSTQVEFLAARLTQRDVSHIITRQPGGTPLGAHLRKLVLDPMTGHVDSRAEALLYAADKAQHVNEVIRPALWRGEVVITDRYVDSMIAYQGAGRALEVTEVARVAWWAVGGLRPDLTILLDADPADAVERVQTKDRLEAAGIELHQRARQHFLDLAAEHPERYLVLSAHDDRLAIAERIGDAVDALLEMRHESVLEGHGKIEAWQTSSQS